MSKRGGWNKGLSKENDVRIARHALALSASMKGMQGHPHSEKTKKELSILAKEKGLGGHTSKRKLHFEKKNGEVVYLQSSFEIRFAQILEELNIGWSRPAPIKWIDDDGVDHRYFPDFQIGKIFIDTKNDYLAIKDARKIELVKNQNHIDLRIVVESQINKEFIARLV